MIHHFLDNKWSVTFYLIFLGFTLGLFSYFQRWATESGRLAIYAARGLLDRATKSFLGGGGKSSSLGALLTSLTNKFGGLFVSETVPNTITGDYYEIMVRFECYLLYIREWSDLMLFTFFNIPIRTLFFRWLLWCCRCGSNSLLLLYGLLSLKLC